jgi:tetrahydromethanopterin:alpha-L-glutamate ligase
MFKVGVISADIEADIDSRELVEVGRKIASVKVIHPGQIFVEVFSNSNFWFGSNKLDSFDALIVRTLDTSADTDFQFEVLETLEKRGILVVNSPRALQIAESKFLTTYFLKRKGLPVPPSVIVQQLEQFQRFLNFFGCVVVKPLYAFQGHGVIRLTKGERNAIELVSQLLKEYGALCVQKYIENPGRDIRAFVVGGKVIGAIYREAREGEWKTSIYAGGVPRKCELSSEQEVLAIKAASELGLHYTGVDLIEGIEKEYVLEVNGAPAWGGLKKATGIDVATEIVKYVISEIKRLKN